MLTEDHMEFMKDFKTLALVLPLESVFLYRSRISIYSATTGGWKDFLGKYGKVIYDVGQNIEIDFYSLRWPNNYEEQSDIETYLEGKISLETLKEYLNVS